MKKEADIFVAVMGMTGAGKSSFIGSAADADIEVGHGLHACTQEIQVFELQLGDQTVHLIDTPGFDDTERSDTEILEEITAWLLAAYNKRALLSGIIYLHRLTDNRMTGSAAKNLRMFRKLCGSKNLANVLLVTTMWDIIPSVSDGERRETELTGTGKFWGRMIAMGAQTRRHNGTKESALRIIEQLLPKKRITLQIQEELSQGIALGDTEAGKEVLSELEAKARETQAELREVKKQMKESMAKTTKEAEVMLSQQRAELDELLRKKERDHEERLRLSNANSEVLRRRILELEHQASRRSSGCVIL